MSNLRILPRDASHLDSLVDALLEVRTTNPYPPDTDTDGTRESLTAWLDEDRFAVAKLVAVVDDVVVGHVQVTKPHPYLLDFVRGLGNVAAGYDNLAEIGKLFVRPDARHSGAGRLLLASAERAAWENRRAPHLAVVSTSHAAIDMYRRCGFDELGTFHGIHGLNLVMRSPIVRTPHTSRI